MKLRWLLALTLLALVAWFWYDDAARDALLGSATDLTGANNTTLYRWQDAQGRWQLSDHPPPGRPYETVRYPHDVNVIPALRPDED